ADYSHDLELGLTSTSSSHEGYERLGKYIGASPEYAVFHGFKSLYAELLLYQQAEIVHLQSEFNELRDRNKSNSSIHPHIHRCWSVLRSSGQAIKIQEIQRAMDKYYDSLIKYDTILRMKKPHLWTIKGMYDWMKDDKLGNVYLTSHDKDIFLNQNPDVMVSLHHYASDSLPSWIQCRATRAFHRFLGRYVARPNTAEPLQGTVTYRLETIDKITRLLTVTFACALPTASIFALHFIPDQTIRLGIVFAMSVVFALCMALMTTAKTHEIFAATSTFAAVLVVFISTDGSVPTDGHNAGNSTSV
ncbi:hypothetical protein QBC37DRAFT_171210, partial [Rhypophila decipiens]